MHAFKLFPLVAAALVALGLPCPAIGGHPNAPKPNFVFLLVDDLGWSDLPAYGNRFHETPAIDRLAREGMRFTDAYAACPVCSPTRASILTGRYPATLNLTDFIPGHWRPWAKLVVPEFNGQLPLEEVTIAEALAPAGYVSGSFGKWHLGPATHFPDKQGFDSWLVTRGGHFFPNVRTFPTTEYPDGAYLADVLTGEAEGFLEANRDRPFFLFLSHYAVHIPLHAKQAKIAKYQAKPKPAQGVNNPIYAGMIESVDESVGRVLAKLDELELTDHTVVILTSDNGGLRQHYRGIGPIVTSSAPLRAEKGTLYEGGIREPLIVRWPGAVAPGSTCDVPVSSVDFYPTLLDVARVEDAPRHHVDGKSLVPLLTQMGKLDREAIFWHYPHYHHSTPAGAIRSGDWKLLEFYEDGKLELYNLKDDLSETLDLAESEPATAARLREMLHDWRASVAAKMPTENPDYDRVRAHQWGDRRKRTTKN